jgi:hypothetical protein
MSTVVGPGNSQPERDSQKQTPPGPGIEEQLLRKYAQTGVIPEASQQQYQTVFSGIARKLDEMQKIRQLRRIVAKVRGDRELVDDEGSILREALDRHGGQEDMFKARVEGLAAKLPELRAQTELSEAEKMACDKLLVRYAFARDFSETETILVAPLLDNMAYKMREGRRIADSAELVGKALLDEPLDDQQKARLDRLLARHSPGRGEPKRRLLQTAGRLSKIKKSREFTDGESKAAERILLKYSEKKQLTDAESALVGPLLVDIAVKVREGRRANQLLTLVNQKLSGQPLGEAMEAAVAQVVNTFVKKPTGGDEDLHAVAAGLKQIDEKARLREHERKAADRALLAYGDGKPQSGSEKALLDSLLTGIVDRAVAYVTTADELVEGAPRFTFVEDHALRAYVFNKTIVDNVQETPLMRALIQWDSSTSNVPDPRRQD